MNHIERLVTNNPAVRSAYEKKYEIDFIDGTYPDVLQRVRDLIHEGSVILTHPLSGSVKPNETPYKSIALAQGGALDFDSLRLIEDAIVVVQGLIKDEIQRMLDPALLPDFQMIDLTLLRSALQDKEY